jgi:hypothetical protein
MSGPWQAGNLLATESMVDWIRAWGIFFVLNGRRDQELKELTTKDFVELRKAVLWTKDRCDRAFGEVGSEA